MSENLKRAIAVPFGSVYLDPNNPRLAPDDPPGYEDPKRLFDPDLQKMIAERVNGDHDADALADAIVGQGWMPIDNIVVFTYPKDPKRHIVVEGNRRTVALRLIRQRLQDAGIKLARMKSGRKKYSDDDIHGQEREIADLERIVDATEDLTVVPIAADTTAELAQKLPRVLAVRHITGARRWESYAEDLWLLDRYTRLYARTHPSKYKQHGITWDKDLIMTVAGEASLTSSKARLKLRTAHAYSHFKREYEIEMERTGAGKLREPGDYYLFELIAGSTWLSQQFGFVGEETYIPQVGERAIYEWFFKEMRGRTADENPNKFYRHECVREWDRMKVYDGRHKTAFAARFSVDAPEEAPAFRVVEADWLNHKAAAKPTDLIDKLIRELTGIPVGTLVEQGPSLADMLVELRSHVDKVLRMLSAVSTS